MIRTTRRPLAALLAAAVVVAAAFVATGSASPSDPANLANVATANTKTPGVSSPNVLSAGLAETPVAQGSNRLENGTPQVPFYGYDGNGSLLPVYPSWTEATKTEPDKNTYLAINGLKGADPSYYYGSHFLFQGHEGGTPGYLTRINPRCCRRWPRWSARGASRGSAAAGSARRRRTWTTPSKGWCSRRSAARRAASTS